MNNNTSVTMAEAIAVAGILTLAACGNTTPSICRKAAIRVATIMTRNPVATIMTTNKQVLRQAEMEGQAELAELAEKAEMADITTTKIPKNRKSIRMQMADMPMGVTVVTPMVATHAPNIKYANKS